MTVFGWLLLIGAALLFGFFSGAIIREHEDKEKYKVMKYLLAARKTENTLQVFGPVAATKKRIEEIQKELKEQNIHVFILSFNDVVDALNRS